jgi:dUTP pyrophosphatase
MKIKVYKIRPDAILPNRAHGSDAGMDLYYCPNGERARVIQDEGLAVEPRQTVLIPTGLKAEVPHGHMLEIKNKSGIAFKRQLIVGACVVDPGYSGEIYINLHNVGLVTQYLQPGDKVAQAVLIPVVHCGVEEVENEETLHYDSLRGTGGFGSTGTR